MEGSKGMEETMKSMEEGEEVLRSRINFPFLVLRNEKEGEMRGKEGELAMRWPKGKTDQGHFDADFLVEVQKFKEQMEFQ